MVVANDPVTGRSVQRSFTVHGDAEQVEEHRRNLVECLVVDRSALYCEGALGTLAERLERVRGTGGGLRLMLPDGLNAGRKQTPVRLAPLASGIGAPPASARQPSPRDRR